MIRKSLTIGVSAVGLGLTTATLGLAGAPQSSGSLGRNHVMPMTTAIGSSLAPSAAKTLTYFGGPVLKSVNVIPVYWNSAVAFQANLNSFYTDFTSSSSSMYASLLTQYSGIGAGTRGTPYVGNQTATSTTDASVKAYLTGLFNAGTLPKPTANNYYPVHFPAGVTVTDSSGAKSCVTWCAYHGTYVYNGVNVNYGIIPDQGGGCAGGCGADPQRVNNLTSVASHELVEATTDPAVGLATTYAAPLAWYNKTYGEIGDICNGQQATITANGHTYVVQKEWSNASNSCKTTK
jgi:hypothetical protein